MINWLIDLLIVWLLPYKSSCITGDVVETVIEWMPELLNDWLSDWEPNSNRLFVKGINLEDLITWPQMGYVNKIRRTKYRSKKTFGN